MYNIVPDKLEKEKAKRAELLGAIATHDAIILAENVRVYNNLSTNAPAFTQHTGMLWVLLNILTGR